MQEQKNISKGIVCQNTFRDTVTLNQETDRKRMKLDCSLCLDGLFTSKDLRRSSAVIVSLLLNLKFLELIKKKSLNLA